MRKRRKKWLGLVVKGITPIAMAGVAAYFFAPADKPEAAAIPVQAVQAVAPSGKPTSSGLPLPRFVSLKAGRVNVRVGPGEDYKIAWVFTKPGLPIEVVQEYDTWRRIRYSDGTMGWVFKSLLSGKRTGVVSPWKNGDARPIYTSASDSSSVAAYLQPGVSGDVSKCHAGWCRIAGAGYKGWIPQNQLWGVYPNEEID
jgi:SH3-like domain-containing protein